jgi:hypothetical protein
MEKEIFQEILEKEMAHSWGGGKVLQQMRQTPAKGGRGESPPPAKSEGAMGRGRARPLPTAEATPWLKRRAMDR